MSRDPLDMRILGAVRFVDSISRTPIRTPLRVTEQGVRLIRNRSNLYVIVDAPGAERFSATFELPQPPAPPVPPPELSLPITLTVVDPSGRYLPRRATVALPRDVDPLLRSQPTSMFQPIDVELFPSPTMPVSEGWATLRLSIRRWDSGIGLPYAFVRVRRASDDLVLGRGVADERGEALVGVSGIPITTWSETSGSEVMTSTVTTRVAACFDPGAFDPETHTFPDPGALEQAFSTLPHSADLQLNLASGREVARRIDVTIPP